MRLLTTCARQACALTVLCLALALVFVPSASASHSFSDVPDAHPFHNEIAIFKDTNITGGCSATEFCPQNPVLRQAMAAFIDRALGLVVRPTESTQKGVPGSRVAMLDDDLTFVGTQGGALEFSYNGVRGLRLDQGDGTVPNVIGGSSANSVTAGVINGTIAGGGDAAAPNRVTDRGGTIGGGRSNLAGNNAGATNDAVFNTVAGGSGNTASGTNATVGGGGGNTASGSRATVAGGGFNTASGDWSFAGGLLARADDQGAFMWADSQVTEVFSAGVDTFNVRAGGGIWLGTTTGTTPAIPAGVFLNTSTGGNLTTGGAWTNSSDRASKERFSAVDGQRLLHALAGVPIQSWSYKKEPGVRHLGPVAQDFYRAFRLGGSDKHIATVDAEGVALAAIQALYADNRSLHAENRKLESTNRSLEARLAALERTVMRLVRAKKR